jgi:hypothetical protein
VQNRCGFEQDLRHGLVCDWRFGNLNNDIIDAELHAGCQV